MIGRRKRKTRIGKVTGTVRLVGRDMEALRREAYFRSNGYCEIRESPKCWGWISWLRAHLCHIKSKGAGGSDVIENVRIGCPECHIGFEHNGGKPCPPKVSQ